MNILIVCTGNICRSPYAQLLLQTHLDSVAPGTFTITSAGTMALVGHGIDPASAEKLRQHGLNSDAFRARKATANTIGESDLILTMNRAQRSLILETDPTALRRTFTLYEFSAVLQILEPSSYAATPDARWNHYVTEAFRHRSTIAHIPSALTEITDPYRGTLAAFETMAAEIDHPLGVMRDWECAEIQRQSEN